MPKAAKKTPKKLTITTSAAPKPKATSADSFATGSGGKSTERVNKRTGESELRINLWVSRGVLREIHEQAFERRITVQDVINERLSRG